MRNIPGKSTITTITRTYHIDNGIRSSQIRTSTRLSGICTKKTIDFHIYPSTYNVHLQMILPMNVLVHIRDENYDMILL